MNQRTFLLVILLVMLATNFKIASRLVENRWILNHTSPSGWHPVRKIPLEVKTTRSGLSVYIPKTTNQCWDSPLPSAPTLNPDLTLRNSKNIASGFTVTGVEK